MEAHMKDKNTDDNTQTKENEKMDEELYSVVGHRMLRIPRHLEVASVFPPAIQEVKVSERASAEPAGKHEADDERRPRDVPSGFKENVAPKNQRSELKNPITGEGYSDNDYRPDLGIWKSDPTQRDKPNPNRIPPGGYSKGFW